MKAIIYFYIFQQTKVNVLNLYYMLPHCLFEVGMYVIFYRTHKFVSNYSNLLNITFIKLFTSGVLYL